MIPVKNMLNDTIASFYDTFKILKTSQTYIIYYHRTLLRALLLPFTLFMAFAILMDYFRVHLVVYLLVLLALMMKNAIVIHRVLIIGHGSVPKWGIEAFNKRESRYFMFQILSMLVIAFLPFLVLNVFTGNDQEDPLASPFYILSQVLAYYLMARISLIFPAAAVDEKLTIKEAWALTTNFKITVFLLIAVVPYVLTSVSNIIAKSVNAYWLSMLMFLLVTAYIVAVLSVTYKRITEDEGPHV